MNPNKDNPTPLTTDEKLEKLLDATVGLRRDQLRTMARLKALESMVHSSVSIEEHSKWKSTLDKQTKLILQNLLEAYEKVSPGFAAEIDDRSDEELDAFD
jgi:hypothetical protein